MKTLTMFSIHCIFCSRIEQSYMMNEYKVLKEIEINPSHTQRSLAEKLNVSLGKINFIISGLVEKGIIKAKKLKNNPDKIRWQYILTAKGLKEKIRITREYLNKRTEEYEYLKNEIEELQRDIDEEGKE